MRQKINMTENEATTSILKIAEEKIQHHTYELKRWQEIARLAKELNTNYYSEKPIVKEKVKKKERSTGEVTAERRSKEKKTPKFVRLTVDILTKENSVLTKEQIRKQFEEQHQKKYTNNSFHVAIADLKYRKEIKDIVLKEIKYYGLKEWFNGEGIKAQYMPKPEQNESAEEETTELNHGYCKKCDKHFGNITRHNEIRHANDHHGKHEFPVVPSSMRN